MFVIIVLDFDGKTVSFRYLGSCVFEIEYSSNAAVDICKYYHKDHKK